MQVMTSTDIISEEQIRLAEHRARLEATGMSRDEIERVIDPMESFHLQLKEEVESHERLKRGEFDELENLRGLGHLLIALRIAQGISQREANTPAPCPRVPGFTR
jgi:predicted DNA-binding protein